ncbi:hypothetical protein CDAR_565621 [Caerostris darwini]|uniref:Uncharacterized protein n=2 Tax=Araneidae TaxID=6913 RepID=A0AAV4UXV9_9ARAC|nr:hypothetical protein CDAR_565621 [Caerostris darwini]
MMMQDDMYGALSMAGTHMAMMDLGHLGHHQQSMEQESKKKRRKLSKSGSLYPSEVDPQPTVGGLISGHPPHVTSEPPSREIPSIAICQSLPSGELFPTAETMPSYPSADLQQLLGTHLNDAAGRRSGSYHKNGTRVGPGWSEGCTRKESFVNGLNWFGIHS